MSISVIIPAYNAELFIARAIESCLIQPEVSEIIVVEDGSSDRTYDLLKTYTTKENKLNLYTHSNRENKGPAHCRNLGLKHAEGDFITFLDADDYYLENRFTSSINKLQKESLDAVYCTAENTGDSTGKYPELVSERTDNNRLFAKSINGTLSIALWTILYRKEAIKKLPRFDPELIVGQDLQYVFHSLKKLKLAHCDIQSPLMIRTLHDQNRTKTYNQSIHIKCRRKIFSYWYNQLEKEGFTREEKHHITKHYSSYILQDALPKVYRFPLVGRLFLRLFYIYNRLA